MNLKVEVKQVTHFKQQNIFLSEIALGVSEHLNVCVVPDDNSDSFLKRSCSA